MTPRELMREFIHRQRLTVLYVLEPLDPFVREALLDWYDDQVEHLVDSICDAHRAMPVQLPYDVVGDTTLQ